jgi:hypothetical protein
MAPEGWLNRDALIVKTTNQTQGDATMSDHGSNSTLVRSLR